jgi:hypothetical protein
MTYDVGIRHRMGPTYDVVTYDVHTISSKPTISHVQSSKLQCCTVFIVCDIVGPGLYIVCYVHHIVYDIGSDIAYDV